MKNRNDIDTESTEIIVLSDEELAQVSGGYRGRRLNMDLVNADIHNVFRAYGTSNDGHDG